MTEHTDDQMLFRAAERATSAPFLMGYLLERHGRAQGSRWVEIAAELGCTREAGARLALCRRPDETSETFADQVLQIASYVGLDPGELARFIREAEAIHSLRKSRPNAGNRGEESFLMAALDRLERGAKSVQKSEDK